MICDHFTWVDPSVKMEENSCVRKIEVEMHCLRLELLSTKVTLRVCKDSESYFKAQVIDAARGRCCGWPYS